MLSVNHKLTGSRIQLLLARFELKQSTRKPLSLKFKLNATDEKSVTITRGKNTQLSAAVHVSKMSLLKFSINY